VRLSLGMGLDNVWTCRICGFIQRRWKAKIKSCVERGFVSTTITIATTTTGFGAALVVSQYSLKHGRASSTAHLKKWLSVITRLSDSPMVNNLGLPQWIRQPSPAILTIAWATFALASLLLYHIHRGDRYQYHILMVVCANCLVGGLILSGRGFFEVLGSYLPLYIQLGFLISMLLHRSILDSGRSGKEDSGCEDHVLLLAANGDKYPNIPTGSEGAGEKC